MRITWSIDPDSRLVRLEYLGSADFITWKREMLEIFAHPDYRPGFGFVANLDEAGVPDAAHLRQVAEFVAAHRKELGGGRWANLTSKPAHLGMTRMAQVFVEGLTAPLQVFENRDEAERWAAGSPSSESS